MIRNWYYCASLVWWASILFMFVEVVLSREQLMANITIKLLLAGVWDTVSHQMFLSTECLDFQKKLLLKCSSYDCDHCRKNLDNYLVTIRLFTFERPQAQMQFHMLCQMLFAFEHLWKRNLVWNTYACDGHKNTIPYRRFHRSVHRICQLRPSPHLHWPTRLSLCLNRPLPLSQWLFCYLAWLWRLPFWAVLFVQQFWFERYSCWWLKSLHSIVLEVWKFGVCWSVLIQSFPATMPVQL